MSPSRPPTDAIGSGSSGRLERLCGSRATPRTSMPRPCGARSRSNEPMTEGYTTSQRSIATLFPELAERCAPTTTSRTVCGRSANPAASRTVANAATGE
jgi:hypothetical protein